MGLLKGGINEVIATTGTNAAPMGIHLRSGKASMVLFCGSHTAVNIERDLWVVANFVHDPVLYVKTAFEDLPGDAFVEETVEGKTMIRLAAADAWAAFFVSVEHKATEALTVSLTLKKEIIRNVAVHPVNRGFNSIIDATVHATRYAHNHDPELKKIIDYHIGIVKKCGGKPEIAALDLLLSHLE
ncbi:DUF447 domain-containing protein [uncultured Methanoregula sp.]|uniref:DUF447 domain-containing protein n=1 Tax=uncultured Methanoregula sp. TaxID=1005933 RepID=UPI002AAA85D0|nr:DUF447 domain-containing protein [uncultured Methanoregula sp.]